MDSERRRSVCYRSNLRCDLYTLSHLFFFYKNTYIFFIKLYIQPFTKINVRGDNIIKNTLFAKDFKKVTKGLNPIITDYLKSEDINATSFVFYLASVTKEVLKEMDDKKINELVLRYMFDEE